MFYSLSEKYNLICLELHDAEHFVIDYNYTALQLLPS